MDGTAGARTRLEPEHPWLVPSLLMSEFDSDPARAPTRRSRRDWILDVGITVVCALVSAASLGARYVSEPPLPAPVLATMAVGGLLALAAVWLWRRFPVTATLAAAVVCLVAPVATAAAGALVFRTTVHRRLRVSLAVVACYAGCLLLGALLYPAGLPYRWYAAICLVSSVALFGTASFVRARRQLLLTFAERAHRAETEQHLHVEQARQGERNRIAREMHDVLAHRLSILSVQAGALEYNPKATPEDVRRSAEVIRGSARQALVDLRQIVSVLRTPGDEGDLGGSAPDRPQPTLADLPGLVAESRDAGMRLLYDAHGIDPAAVPAVTGRSAYRIVQEGLTNARKHAPGASVTVTVSGRLGGDLVVDVRNPVPRTAAASSLPGSGTGLIGLAERASLAGGTLTHGATPAGEFLLHASLPWPA